ncbi:MAG: hypothetical protein KF832_09925 [Caldilineaceae bacterium]|nr:hypothetical protein [Caldilineaceae bacterium]
MKRSIRFSLLLVLICSLLGFDTQRTLACSCAFGRPLADTLASATAVFAGTVTQIEPPAQHDGEQVYASMVTVAVNQAWKGPASATISLASSSVCLYPFEVDKAYLIFANEADGQLAVSLCDRIYQLDEAAQTIALLNTIYWDDSPFQQRPPAKVTVRGYSTMNMVADRTWVRYSFAVRQPAGANDALRQQILDALAANGISKSLHADYLALDQAGFQLMLDHASSSAAEMATLLDRLQATADSLGRASEASIRNIEVMFALRDCTLLAVNGQRSAIGDARLRAELLVAPLGGRVAAITELVDLIELPLATAPAYVQCGSVSMGQWHELPLTTDLEKAMQIRTEAFVAVTFAVAEAVSGMPVLSAPASPQTESPLPTPSP